MTIKEYYNIDYIKRISEQMAAVYPDFLKDNFIDKMAAELGEQTYTEKMIIISKGLYECFPSYSKALRVFTAILGEKMKSMSEMYDVGMHYAPFGKFIELYAVENEDCYDQTLHYIYEMTQRYSGEFAMRPLLKAFPKRTLEVIKMWTDDESDCVRRLCSECMRVAIPWGSKLTFALEYFDGYCEVLLKLATDDCEYVRRSVANNLNELCKADLEKAKILIDKLRAIDDKNIKTVITHGTRYARKKEML